MRKAALQVVDTGPLESLSVMLKSAGYDSYLLSQSMRGELRSMGCDNVAEIDDLVRNWGYEAPARLPSVNRWSEVDLYVDVKAHRNGPKLWAVHPELRDRTLWYRINGGKPEHVIRADGFDCGDEVNPPCPVLTPNQWYKKDEDIYAPEGFPREARWKGKAYACWPPFVGKERYWRHSNPTGSPVCFVHNLAGWGFGALEAGMRSLGVRMYGVRSPDGLLPHTAVPGALAHALAYVHLKGSDAPGYALYEALSSGCPCVVHRALIWKNAMEELFDESTCLMYGAADHAPPDPVKCCEEVELALGKLRDREFNKRIGEAGKERLEKLMWSEERDAADLARFLQRNFP